MVYSEGGLFIVYLVFNSDKIEFVVLSAVCHRSGVFYAGLLEAPE